MGQGPSPHMTSEPHNAGRMLVVSRIGAQPVLDDGLKCGSHGLHENTSRYYPVHGRSKHSQG